jgi:hypothetical protein
VTPAVGCPNVLNDAFIVFSRRYELNIYCSLILIFKLLIDGYCLDIWQRLRESGIVKNTDKYRLLWINLLERDDNGFTREYFIISSEIETLGDQGKIT